MGPLKIYTGLLLGMDITGREVGTIFGTILIRALDRNLAKSASAAPVGEQRVNSGHATATRVDKVLDCLCCSLFP